MITQVKTQTQIAVAEFVTKLRAGERLTQNVVIELISYIFGDLANGKWHWKQATDLIEAAVVRMLLDDDFKSLEDVENLQSLIPHHQVRSQQQIQFQQFSTPLALAWIVGQLSSVKGSDIIAEPSAGTGILAAATVNRLFYDKPRRIILNEISPSRKALLRELFDAQHPVYSVNAEYLNDTLNQGEQPTLILMNPPFSSSIGNDKRDKECCMKHLRSALLRLEQNGRLVAIVPHWLSPEKQSKYFASLPSQLQLSLFVSGNHYRHHGTTMDTRILVFDKIQQIEIPKSIDLKFSVSARELATIAAESCASRIIFNPYERIEPKDEPAVAASSIQLLFAGLPLFQLQPAAQLQITFKPVIPIPNLAPPIVVMEPRKQFDDLVQLDYQPATKDKSPMTDGVYAVYKGAISIAGANPHPSPICESIAMSAIDPPLPTVRPILPARVCDFTGLRLVNDSGQLLDTLPQMNTFLNRLLALPIGLQNILFCEFEQRISERIEQAKAAGSYERGVENLFGDGGFEVIETQILNTHSSGAQTICYSIDKLNKPHLVSIDSAQHIAHTQEFSCYRHAKTGNLAIAGEIDKRIKRDGAAVDVMAIYQPVSSKSWQKLDLPDFEKVWIPEIPTNHYWKQWQQLIDLAPEFECERIYLICGLLLPVWKQLPDSNPKVFRLQTNDGRILLGRAIDPHQIEKVFDNFGLKDLIKLNAEDIFKLVWEHRLAKSVGQWELQRNYYKGVDRLEVLAVYGSDRIDWLKALGCFTEIIQHRTKVFIPVDNAVEIIDLLLTSG